MSDLLAIGAGLMATATGVALGGLTLDLVLAALGRAVLESETDSTTILPSHLPEMQ